MGQSLSLRNSTRRESDDSESYDSESSDGESYGSESSDSESGEGYDSYEDEEQEPEQQDEQEESQQKEQLVEQQELEKLQTQEEREGEEQTTTSRDLRQLLRPTQHVAPLKGAENKPKDLRLLLRRTLSGADFTGENIQREAAEKPKDLRLLLRRTQSGVSLTGEGDGDKRTDTRPQLRGLVPALSELGEDSRPQSRPSLSPRSPRDNTAKEEKGQGPGGQETKKIEKERPQLRRNTSGSDREDEEKKNPRLQFRRTVSAPSLKIFRDRKRLIRCAGKKRIHVREIEPVAESLNNCDVYETQDKKQNKYRPKPKKEKGKRHIYREYSSPFFFFFIIYLL